MHGDSSPRIRRAEKHQWLFTLASARRM